MRTRLFTLALSAGLGALLWVEPASAAIRNMR